MLKLTNRYANALLEYAREQGMGEIYRQALLLAANKGAAEAGYASSLLGEFFSNVPQEEREAVLYRFLGLAREHMDMLQVEIISAVPLREEQVARIEERLIRMFRKQLEINTRVDPSLLGGLRIIVGNTVLENTIKSKLQDMKRSIYKGVYFNQWN